ncbi:MAG: mandelate racemase [Gemmatimonadetes bacterium]|nr:mandelate racemase [Gemmatimonadota bacterium]
MAEAVALKEARFYMRNVRTRMPFRYGAATLVSVPILHVGVTAELGDSTPARGWAADILPPKWFDKDPAKEYGENVADLIAMARFAEEAYGEASRRPRSLFALWRDGYEGTLEAGRAAGLNRLTAGHGSSLFERALIDAIGTARGLSYHQLLRRDALGIELSALHEELRGIPVSRAVPEQPLEFAAVRHTVGMADPIRTGEIPADERLDDGLPQALEEYIGQGIRYLKVKLDGVLDSDLGRLRQIAEVLGRDREYSVSLDGNEQYGHPDELLELMEAMRGDHRLRGLYGSVIYIEQPLDRGRALDGDLAGGIRALSGLKPVVIDESDDALDSFARAAGVGYNGVSAKNCKGLIKAIANRALILKLSAESGAPFFMTAEDLMNLPVVPLQQDLAQVAALGIDHVERNGHHYVRGLDHLSEAERTGCEQVHAGLYRREGGMTRLDVRDGRIDLRSLQVPGLGVGVRVDRETMVPLDQWRFDSL